MTRRPFDWDQRVRFRPTPRAVADIVTRYGWDAAEERWSWLEHRALQHILKKAGTHVDPDECPDDFEVEDLEP